MVIAKPPLVIKEDYTPDALKKTKGYLFGDFKFMPTKEDRIRVSSLKTTNMWTECIEIGGIFRVMSK